MKIIFQSAGFFIVPRSGMLILLGCLIPLSSHAYPTGITGHSGSSGDDCTNCHTTSSPYTGTASVSGTGTVDRGSTTGYTLNLSGSGAVDAGFNLSATGGTLNDTDANAYKSSGELTHNSPQALSGNATSWSFSWTAPAGSSGDYTFYFCINQVNGNRDGMGNGYTGDNPVCSTRTITVDNNPVVSNAVANFSVNEDAANDTFSLTNIFSDTEDADSALTYAVIGNTDSTLVSASVNNSTDVLTLDYQADQNGSATITVRATDSEGQAVSDVFTVTVNAVNDAPVLSGVDNTPTYTEGDAGVVIDSSIGVSDPDNTNCNQATVDLSTNHQSAEDLLEYSGSLTSSFNSSTGTLTLSDTATCTTYANELESVTYRNNSLNPNTSDRTVVFQVRDSGNVLSNTGSTTITVQSLSTPPTISGVDNTPNYTEDGPGVVIDSAISVTDPDSTNCNQATIDLSTNHQPAEDLLEYSGSLGSSFNAAAGTLTLSGTVACATYANELESVTYRNTSQSPNTALRTVVFQVRDDGSVLSNTDSTTVAVTATNDAPQAVDDTASVPVNSSDNQIDVLANDTDVDTGDTLSLVSVGAPDNGGSVVIGAPCSADTLCYTPPPDYTGTNTFSYTMRDAANAQDSATVTVGGSDADGDGVIDYLDNCPDDANAGQEDEDGDGIGDGCDLDVDGDGMLDGYVRFSIDQGGAAGSHVLQTGGTVTVTGSLTVAPGTQDLTFSWGMSDPDLLNIATVNEGSFSFDPATLQAGHFMVDLRISEEVLSTRNWMLVTVVDSVPATDGDFDCDGDGAADSNPDCDGDNVLNLTDGIRDRDNDGIPDYRDEFDDPVDDSHLLPNQTGNPADSLFVTTEEGLSIRLGATAVRAGRLGGLVTAEDIENHGGPNASRNGRDLFANVGGFFDFEITGLSRAGDTVSVVVPLAAGIPFDAEYRKYSSTGGWRTFQVNGDESVASAADTLGLCPAPGSSEYDDGLKVPDRCVQLTIRDGGPNDADGLANGVIRDPGGVAVADITPEHEVETPDDGSGGGLLHPLWLLMMVWAWGAQTRRQG